MIATPAQPSVLIIGAGPANFDPSPPACKISFDKDGHAIALSESEHLGLPLPAPTPMYQGVTANTPRDIMPYRSHPYPAGTDEYPTKAVILDYLTTFGEKHLKHIRFNRAVTRVRHNPFSPSPSAKKWLVEWMPAGASVLATPNEESFDHVVVANGSDSRPFIPYLDGLWEWKGEVIHSRWYRTAEAFAGKTVMVVGSGPSSADIVQELGSLIVIKSPLAAKKVYRSIRTAPRYDIGLETGWRDHIITVKPMKLLSAPSAESPSGRIVLTDDEILDDIDVIIFATSFVVRFEFFKENDAPWKEAPLLHEPEVPGDARRPPDLMVGNSTLEGGFRVHNLDVNGIFYLPDPSIALLLLHAEAIPWPFSEMQARVIAFEYAERLLKLIGEGGSEEVDKDGNWGSWPEYKKHIRALID
ncbi:hypothetical protein RQP46_001774 [Phenoliferia psychrophenolica]